MTNLTHWKRLTNPDYLGAYDFQEGEERIVSIKSVERKTVPGPDGKKEECTIIFFNEPFKPMILNVTNAKMITKLAETPYIEQWIGVTFKLVVTKVRAFGEMVDALRIKHEKLTTPKPELLSGSENFTACKKALKAGTHTIEQVKMKYNVSDAVEKLLTAE